jgi:hypothetical protein
MCKHDLLRPAALEWYSFQLQGCVNYSSISVTLPREQQRDCIDEIMWEFHMLYFLSMLFVKGSIQSGAEFYDSMI